MRNADPVIDFISSTLSALTASVTWWEKFIKRLEYPLAEAFFQIIRDLLVTVELGAVRWHNNVTTLAGTTNRAFGKVPA